MEDSDSGVASMSSGHGASSLGGDDRSGAGSRSSAASLSEVSSPAPPQHYAVAQQQQPLALTVPRSSSAVSQVPKSVEDSKNRCNNAQFVDNVRNLFGSGAIPSCC